MYRLISRWKPIHSLSTKEEIVFIRQPLQIDIKRLREMQTTTLFSPKVEEEMFNKIREMLSRAQEEVCA